MKRILILVLSLLLIASMVTPLVSSAEGGKRTISTSRGDYTFNEEGFPVTDEPSTFSIVMATTVLSFDDSAHMKSISEATNIYPEFIIVPQTSAADRKALIYASGDYPDVMGSYMVSKVDTINYGPTGILMNIKDYLKKYATNLNTFLTDDLWVQMECYDGNIYFLPTFYANLGGTANGLCGWFGQPSGWYDRLGIKEPVTVDELFNNLIAIRDNDANGNGDPNDEIPLGIMSDSSAGDIMRVLPSIACLFGRPATYYILDDGTVIDGRLYDENRESLKFLQKCYKEKLLDPETFSMTQAAFRAKGNSQDGTYGYVFGFNPAWLTSNELCEQGVYTVMPLLEYEEGKKIYIYRNSSSSGLLYQWAITSACEAPEIVVRYCDYLWDPVVTLCTNNGAMGVRYFYNDDGKVERNDDVSKLPSGYSDFGTYYSATQEQQIPRLYGPLVTDYMNSVLAKPDELSIMQKLNYQAYDLWEPYKVQEIPVVTPTLEESETEQFYSTDLEKYYSETVIGWIVSDADIDAEWETFVNTMNAFGDQEIIAIKQAQSDRYFAALNK